MTGPLSGDSMAPSGPIRIALGLAPERRWPETEALRSHAALLALLDESGAWLVADGVRELLTNAWVHGNPTPAEAELLVDAPSATVTLRVPGDEFDSVLAAADPGNRWLHRYDRMLAAAGMRWRWSREGALNVVELRLACSGPDQGGRV